MKEKIGIIGAGMSGISLANLLNDKATVQVFEKGGKVGGLIGCDRVEDILYHRVGGHVFNAKNKEVLNWFWSFFDKDQEFIQAKRFAKVFIEGKLVDYPIENSIYQLDREVAEKIIKDLLSLDKNLKHNNFGDFLLNNFGSTLYEIYFKPYNKKIWNVDLTEVPLEWLEGKLPMPQVEAVITANILRGSEEEMVHSFFYYPVQGGSQFIIDRMSKNIDVVNNASIATISKASNGKIVVDNEKELDKLIYTGDIRKLPSLLDDAIGLAPYQERLNALKSNGTTNILCRCDATALSWMYIPEEYFKAHRIIYTGNFSEHNNDASGRRSCTVEFSNFVSVEDAKQELSKLPGNLEFVAYNYEPNSYVIQTKETRQLISEVKAVLEKSGIYLLGRFAEWEYYNMDKCIEAAMTLVAEIGATD
jgi:protoporphyrinogen oxidase